MVNLRRPTRADLKKLAVFALKSAVGVALIYWLIETGRLDLTIYDSLVGSTALLFLLSVVAFQGVSLSLIIVRWWFLVRVQGVKIGFLESLRLGYQGAVAGIFLPGALGIDGMRILYLRRHYPRLMASGLASIVLDKALGFLGLLVLGSGVSIAFALKYPEDFYGEVLAVSTLSLLLAVLAVLLVCGFLPNRAMTALKNVRYMGGFISAFQLYSSVRRVMVLSVGISVVAHTLVVGGACMGLLAMGLDYSWIAVALVTPSLILIRFLPLTPLGLGVADLAGEELYILFGIPGGAENQMLLRFTWIVLLLGCSLSFFGGPRRHDDALG